MEEQVAEPVVGNVKPVLAVHPASSIPLDQGPMYSAMRRLLMERKKRPGHRLPRHVIILHFGLSPVGYRTAWLTLSVIYLPFKLNNIPLIYVCLNNYYSRDGSAMGKVTLHIESTCSISSDVNFRAGQVSLTCCRGRCSCRFLLALAYLTY